MLETINLVVDVMSIWFIAYTILLYCQYKVWYQMLFKLVQKISDNMKILFIIYILLNVLGVVVQIICIRTQVNYDFGFLISVAYPVFIFYASIIILVWFLIKAFKKKFLSTIQLYSLIPCMYTFFLTQLSFSFANSSPCGILLSFIYLIKTFYQRSLFFQRWSVPKKKEE